MGLEGWLLVTLPWLGVELASCTVDNEAFSGWPHFVQKAASSATAFPHLVQYMPYQADPLK